MLKPSTPEGREGHAPWSILAIVLLAGLAGTLSYYKVPPIMPLLIDAFQVSRSTAGLLMSVFAVAGIALAIPAGLILDRLRGRTMGTIALCFIALGSGIGALSHHIGLMLVSRLVEGIGLTLMAIVAPMMIAYRFDAQNRSVALGILNVWFPLGFHHRLGQCAVCGNTVGVAVGVVVRHPLCRDCRAPLFSVHKARSKSPQ